MKRLLTAMIGCLLLAACSTEIYTQQPLPAAMHDNIAVKNATAQIQSGVLAPPDTAPKLVDDVTKLLAAHPSGLQPVTLKMTVVRYEIVSGTMRFFTGMFSGSNKLYVSVDVVDANTGALIGHYDVLRESNPGGYGAFYDQDSATVQSAAEGVVDGLYKTN